jgi:DNA polymerase alpha subunit B
MFEKVSQRSEALDDMIDEFADMMRDAYDLPDIGDPNVPSEESIYAVGRILSAPTDGSKLSSNALLLESSRVLGAGKRIPLRFRPSSSLILHGGTGGFGVFPGCVICVRGRNGGAGFVVDEVLLVSCLLSSPF